MLGRAHKQSTLVVNNTKRFLIALQIWWFLPEAHVCQSILLHMAILWMCFNVRLHSERHLHPNSDLHQLKSGGPRHQGQLLYKSDWKLAVLLSKAVSVPISRSGFLVLFRPWRVYGRDPPCFLVFNACWIILVLQESDFNIFNLLRLSQSRMRHTN